VSAPLHTVHVRVNDAVTGQPTPVRIRFTGPDGTYYPPFGRASEFAAADLSKPYNPAVEGSVFLPKGRRTAAYIDGTCEINLPPGPITVEISKGFEYKPFRQVVDQPAGKMAMRFGIERWVDLRAERWYSGDSRIHSLTPHAALLEGAAEDVAVVNLLTLHTENLLAFSGQKPALEVPGHMVVVNTFNHHRVLGQLALLNAHRIVFPLMFGQPDGPDNWTLADWCDQCHRKAGLVVWSGIGYPGLAGHGEQLADLILGNVDAVELPLLTESLLREYYSLLDCNLRPVLVSGSGKAGFSEPIGKTRTYARLKSGEEFNYKNWIEAVCDGRTFVTAGPLVELTVNGAEPGAAVALAAPGKVRIHALARSLQPFDRLEIVVNGAAVAGVEASGSPSSAVVDGELDIAGSGWLAARCWGKAAEAADDATYCTAHTNPVFLEITDKPHAADPINLAYLTDHLNRMQNWAENGARYETDKQRETLIGIFEAARTKLVQLAKPASWDMGFADLS
jgi:hypothetical protein